MSLAEAAQILNVSDTAELSVVQTRFDQIFSANDPANGGSFYLQSKIYRAHQCFVNKHRRERETA